MSLSFGLSARLPASCHALKGLKGETSPSKERDPSPNPGCPPSSRYVLYLLLALPRCTVCGEARGLEPGPQVEDNHAAGATTTTTVTAVCWRERLGKGGFHFAFVFPFFCFLIFPNTKITVQPQTSIGFEALTCSILYVQNITVVIHHRAHFLAGWAA